MASLEICVDSVASAVAAEAGGADRVELCSALIEGGLTPSLGLIRTVRSRVNLGLHVLIRPRGGDFLYSEEELTVMREDILVAAQSGADGVVFGLLTADSDVDVERTRALVALARPLQVTFHRAIDMARDVQDALERVIQTGADRVLTSGGESTAMLGRSRLRELVRASRGRIQVMAGGGIHAENIAETAQITKATAFHAALRRSVASPVRHTLREVHLGDPRVDDYKRTVVRSDDVRALREALSEGLLRDPDVMGEPAFMESIS
ncbi:MAG: copper homeostasis protein CutC [Janthinobacterium lividum]